MPGAMGTEPDPPLGGPSNTGLCLRGTGQDRGPRGAKGWVTYQYRKVTDFSLFLKPLPPRQDSLESMQVFRQHCQIAEEYHEVRKEIALLEERK